AVPAVGEGAGDRHQHQRRELARGAHDAQDERRARQPVDEPAQRDLLDPDTDERRRLAGDEEAHVPPAKAPQRPPDPPPAPVRLDVMRASVRCGRGYWLVEDFWRQFGHSVFIRLMTMLLTVVIGSLASFALGAVDPGRARPGGAGRQRVSGRSISAHQREARKSVIRDAARIIIPMRSGSVGSAWDETLAITISRERSTTRNWPWMPKPKTSGAAPSRTYHWLR